MMANFSVDFSGNGMVCISELDVYDCWSAGVLECWSSGVVEDLRHSNTPLETGGDDAI